MEESSPNDAISSDSSRPIIQNAPPDQNENILLKIKRCIYKNRKQMAALVPGFLILGASGMHLVWAIYFPTFGFIAQSAHGALHLTLSWFIGALIGGLITAFLVRTKKRIYFSYFSEFLVIVSGILFTWLDSNAAVILIARYLGGIAYGVMFLTTVIHAGEIAADEIRGWITSSLALGISMGLVVASALTLNLQSMAIDMTLNRLYGIIFIVFGVLALVVTPFTGWESPIFLIDNSRNDEALEEQQLLRNETSGSGNAHPEFEDLKAMVAEDKAISSSIISNGNSKALFRITLSRLFLALSMLPTLNFYQFELIMVMVASVWGLFLLVLARFIGEIFSTTLMDLFGRRILLSASCLGCGLMLTITGILSFRDGDTKTAAAILALVYQLCLGLGISTVGITYMSESFPLTKKPFSCFVCLAAELLLHILVIYILYSISTSVNISAMFFSVGIIQIIGAIIFYAMLKETKRTSLRECRDIMKSC